MSCLFCLFINQSPFTACWGWMLLKNKGGSISFQNPFLLCPWSVWLGIRTQSVLGTSITNFHFRFLLHRINYYVVVLEYLFPFFYQLLLIEYDQSSLKLKNLMNFSKGSKGSGFKIGLITKWVQFWIQGKNLINAPKMNPN